MHGIIAKFNNHAKETIVLNVIEMFVENALKKPSLYLKNASHKFFDNKHFI